MGFFLYNFKTWFQKNTTGKMFEQVTLQHFFLGVNHLKKSRRYFGRKKNLQNQEEIMKEIRSHGLLNRNSPKCVKKIGEKKLNYRKLSKRIKIQ